jgi:hypothetical protein
MTIKKVTLLLAILLINNTIVFADSDSKEEKTTNFIVTPAVAYRYDVFKWSIPHSEFTNKKLSELVWKNRILQPSIKIEIEPKANQFTFLGQIKYGYILKNLSENWDYDWYVAPDKTGNIISGLYSKTKSAVKGNILDLSGAIGYSLNLFNNNLLTFYLGYDYTDYRNKDYGARQLAGNQNCIVIPFNQLLNKYNFTTQSPWVGLSVNVPLHEKFTIIPTIKFYSFKYVGKGYWLLRDELKKNPSFKHNAKGAGLGFDVDFIYKYSDSFDFKINLEVKNLKMKSGQKQTFFVADYRNRAIGDTGKLFDLSLISSSITAGFRYKM